MTLRNAPRKKAPVTDRRPRQRLLLLATLALAPLAPAFGADVSLESPFLPVAGAAASQGKPGLLEFRGVLSSGGETYFNLVEASSKKSSWVKLNEAGRDYVVKNYQVIELVDTVTVEYLGRSLTLQLKAAKTGRAAPVAAPGPLPAAGFVQPPAPAAAVLNPTPADEKRRLEEFSAEIARRRMQRAKQASEQHSPQNSTPPQPQTR